MKVTKALLVKYHRGDCTENEKLAVESWLSTDDAEQSFPDNFDLDNYQQAGWEKLSKRYELDQNQATDLPFKRKPLLKQSWLQVAACFVLISLVVLLYAALRGSEQRADSITYQTIVVHKGQKKQVTLSDGTEVWLNSDSRLTFPQTFNGINRSVKFSGEAYFSVAKNKSKPFIIHSPRTITKVVGTRFNLKDYQEERKSELSVEEGKVLFSGLDTTKRIVLTADQRGFFSVDNHLGPVKSDRVYQSIYASWRQNTLVFDDLTLSEIKPVLERWYDVKISIASKSLAAQRYKGSFNNAPINVVLNRICFALRADYIQHDKTFSVGK